MQAFIKRASYAPSPVSGQAIMSNLPGLKLQSDGAVYEHGVLVGYRREVTENNLSYSVAFHNARGHRNGYGPSGRES